MTVQTLTESSSTLGKIEGKRRWFARLIAVGHGSSAVHTEEALASTGASAWPKGTRIHVNHQGWESLMEFPAGNLETLAGVVASTPVMHEEDGVRGLYAEVEFSEKWAPFVEEFSEFIGLSISSGFFGEELDENTGLPIVEGYIPSRLNTVDLVTVEGAKGKLLRAMESYIEKHDIIGNDKNTPRKEGHKLTPEELQEAFEKAFDAALPRIVEALTPKVDEQEEVETDVETVAEAVATANLPESARKRVYEAVRSGEEVAEAISKEQTYISEIEKTIQESAKQEGRMQSASETRDFTQGGWN